MVAWSTFFISKRASQALGSKKRKTHTMKRFTLASLLLLLCSGIALAQQPISLVNAAGTLLGAPSNYGTSPGAVEVIGVNAYVTNTPAVTESGTWNMRITGNVGGIFDTTAGATAAANSLEMGAVY